MKSFDSGGDIFNLQNQVNQRELLLAELARKLFNGTHTKRTDTREIQEHARRLQKMVARLRRTTSLNIELFAEIDIELNNRLAEINRLRSKTQFNYEMLGRAQHENESIHKLIETLTL